MQIVPGRAAVDATSAISKHILQHATYLPKADMRSDGNLFFSFIKMNIADGEDTPSFSHSDMSALEDISPEIR